MKRVLVAGVGNIFLGDDAFGVELAHRLMYEKLPPGVRVAEFGIRSLHLAYELAEGGYDLTLLLDASRRGGKPGTLYVIEPEFTASAVSPDAHSMSPEAVLAAVRLLGGKPGRLLVVGCEPESVEERMGLSAPVTAALQEGVRLVRDLIAHELEKGAADVPGDSRTDRAIAS